MGKQSRQRQFKKGEEEIRLGGGLVGGAILGASLGGPPGAVIGALIGFFLAGSMKAEKQKPRKTILKKGKNMADKIVFVAFAIEDETQRDLLKGQSLHTDTDFEFIDMSVKEPYEENWKEKVRTRIKRSDGIIVLVSKNSPNSSGQKWEISCAKEEKKPILAIWAYKEDRTTIPEVTAIAWTWDAIEKFINKL